MPTGIGGRTKFCEQTMNVAGNLNTCTILNKYSKEKVIVEGYRITILVACLRSKVQCLWYCDIFCDYNLKKVIL